MTWLRLSWLLCLVVLICGCSARGVHHVVQPGQTLYRIGKTYGVSEVVIAGYNRIANPDQIRAGDVLFIPGARQSQRVSVPGKTTQSAVATIKSAARPATVPPKQPPAVATGTAGVSSMSAARPTGPTRGRLRWPVQGQLAQSFKAGRGKGIEIAVSPGSQVRSAAAGQVIYSGTGIVSYGHLIIIQHSDNLYTVYGYNQRGLVKQGSFVNAGQEIARSGTAPGSQRGMLHFEVRQGNKAVDPVFYLP
ncbi:peptidoglycan DD-metalloendopeptidase family protein [Desulfuromonas thiophila]|uniref:peptidoglycan DD-metalloendopeptidase family protein n=1 Tax=Desulfuromonas thiophila TaxID=57664 RepID=UPI0029F4C620|nr:peptidoglycan DD-metalloendopeptidase family protein [Desulfuromonas thiophila]